VQLEQFFNSRGVTKIVPSAVFLRKTALDCSGSLYTNWRTAIAQKSTQKHGADRPLSAPCFFFEQERTQKATYYGELDSINVLSNAQRRDAFLKFKKLELVIGTIRVRDTTPAFSIFFIK
jgi:hypothetical protein